MTALTKPVVRQTKREYGGKPIILTIAPAGAQDEALIGLRLKGQRTQYVMALSDIYRQAALRYGQKEAQAKREARRNGVPWRTARRAFLRANSIEDYRGNGV